jgi:NADH pyrophosphatase NudC (nudix superfamily)
MTKKRIRPIALGLIEHQGHVFVSLGQDQADHSCFYRFLGGGIDFGETSEAALRREFQEEIQAELTHIEYLSCLENIFTCHGKPGHELIQLFRCEFVDPAFYQLDGQFTLVEGKHKREALWISIQQIHAGKLNLVPQTCHQFLDLS